jgi:hypothetical protein
VTRSRQWQVAACAAWAMASGCGANPRPVSPTLANRPLCVTLVTSGVSTGGIYKPGPPFVVRGETTRVMEPTGDTASVADTMLVEFTDSIVSLDHRQMHQAKVRFRALEGGWFDQEGRSGWETADDSIVIVEQGYGYYFRSSHPLVPFDGAGAFRSGTHTGEHEEGIAWLRPRTCSDSAL